MFSPSFHVHGQRRVTDTRFSPKVRFTRCCPALRFLAKITCVYHDFAQFSCTRPTSGVHGQSRVTDTRFLPESPFHTLLPGICYLLTSHHSHITMIPEPGLISHHSHITMIPEPRLCHDRAFFHDLGILLLID